MMMNLNETYARIEELLQIELQVATESIQTRQARREEIAKEIRTLTSQITTLNNRFRSLPDLPPIYIVEWAQAIQRFPNLTFLVLDTTSVDDNADIIRVLVADREGKSLLDELVRPERQNTANTAYTGISEEQVCDAPSLRAIWPKLRVQLAGCYVLAYNLDFVVSHLDENATHYHLPGITLIGECLQDKARQYWSTYYRPKLAALCERIGNPLPQPAMAPDRVAGQLALLKAMAQGIMAVPVGVEGCCFSWR